MPGEQVLAARAARADGDGSGRVGAHIGAALPLGHRHAEQRATLGCGRPQAKVVVERCHQRLPSRRQLGLVAKGRKRRVGHRDRAPVSPFDLRPHVERGRARGVGAGARFAPGQRVEAVADGDLHQPVPRGVELDLVDAVAEAIVGAQLRRVGVGLESPGKGLFGAGEAAQLEHHVLRPGAALPFEGLAQRAAGLEQVVVDERRRLIQRSVHRCNRLLARQRLTSAHERIERPDRPSSKQVARNRRSSPTCASDDYKARCARGCRHVSGGL